MSGIRTAADLRLRCWVCPDTGCWHWRGGHNSKGQPAMWLPLVRRAGTLPTLIAILRTGTLPRPGEVWHATCGTRNCANPAHRRRGTRASQMLAAGIRRDALQRARISRRKRKVSDAQLAEIMAARGVPLHELAARYGLSRQHVCSLRSGRRLPLGLGAGPFAGLLIGGAE